MSNYQFPPQAVRQPNPDDWVDPAPILLRRAKRRAEVAEILAHQDENDDDLMQMDVPD